MPIITENDPNEAYEVVPMPVHPHGPRGGWWSVTCSGIPVRPFARDRKAIAERSATNPAYRLSLITKKLHERHARDGIRR